MKFIEPSVEIIRQEPGIDGIMKIIELAGRTAYKSEDKITEDSSKKFVDMLSNRNHGAALEHGTVYLTMQYGKDREESDHTFRYTNNKFSFFNLDELGKYYITTNYRVLFENGWLDDLKYLCEPTEHHEKRITVKFICSRGVSHEFVRHRVFSFLQESTRYCNYSKDKFGNSITYVIPRWVHTIQEDIASTIDPLTYIPRDDIRKLSGISLIMTLSVYDRTMSDFVDTLQLAERVYKNITTLDDGTKLVPQFAREVLPTCLKTELVMTGTVKQWEGFFKLRCANNAHPDAKYLADKLLNLFETNGIIH